MNHTCIPPHLRIFNPNPLKGARRGSLPQFSRLPPELRDHIWTLTVKDERHLLVGCRKPQQRDGSSTSGHKRSYEIVVHGRPDTTIAKVLLVNRESREAVSRFYRVQLPCYYECDGRSKIGTFYFNPEMDTVQGQMHCDSFIPGNAFSDFVDDLRAHDPLEVGLINYALNSRLMNWGETPNRWAQQVSNFRRVTFVTQDACGRITLTKYLHSGWIWRSRPISADVTRFDRLPRDPRPIQDDLREVFMGICDPRRMARSWFDFLKWSDIKPPFEVTYKWKVAMGSFGHVGHGYMIRNRDSAASFVAMEDEGYGANAGEGQGGLDYDLERAPQPAFGFWTFPVEALGTLEGEYDRLSRVEDLSKFEPELCLYHLED